MTYFDPDDIFAEVLGRSPCTVRVYGVDHVNLCSLSCEPLREDAVLAPGDRVLVRSGRTWIAFEVLS